MHQLPFPSPSGPYVPKENETPMHVGKLEFVLHSAHPLMQVRKSGANVKYKSPARALSTEETNTPLQAIKNCAPVVEL